MSEVTHRKLATKDHADTEDLSEATTEEEKVAWHQKLKTFIWNPDERSVLGRTSTSWGKISLYYACFYLLLSGFFIALFAIFTTTISRNLPTYFNTESVMDYRGVNPGLGFRPLLSAKSSLLNMGTPDSNEKLATSYQEYVKEFLETQNTSNKLIDCMINTNNPLKRGEVCRYEWDTLIPNNHPCSVQKKGGYEGDNPSPCVIIKLNRIIGWVPKPGNVTIDKPDAPPDFVYFNCSGARDADHAMFPNVTYYSLGSNISTDYGSLPYSYFPFYNVEGYITPYVVARFSSLPKQNVLNVICRAWAPNIDNKDTLNNRGMVQFQLFRQ